MQGIIARHRILPVAIFTTLFAGHSHADILTVGVDATYATIGAALDEAVAGDTIEIGAGNYAESLVIDVEDITLTGEPGAIIEVGLEETGVLIAADGVTIENLTFLGPYTEPFTDVDWDSVGNTTAVWIASGTGVNIRNNVISDVRTGITVFSPAQVAAITGNEIDNTKGSILLRADVPVISGNSIGDVGNEWDIVILASIWNAAPASLTLLPDQSDAALYGARIMELSADNGDMTVLDRRFADANRSHAYVKSGANPGPLDDFGLGNGLGNPRQPYGAIQHGVTAVVRGGNVLVASGTYSENLTLTKTGVHIDANGATLQVTSGNAITVQADGLQLSGLDLVKSGAVGGSGIDISGSVTRNDLGLTDVSVSGFTNGLYVGDATSVDGLDVIESQFNGNKFGWYLSKSTANASNVTNVYVADTTFNDNTSKAIYIEKLSNADFNAITVDDSGTDLVSWPPSNGIDINLKWSAYSDITIRNSEFINSGHYADTPLGDLSGAVVIKARDDDPPTASNYSDVPASLTGLTITSNTFTSAVPLSLVGLRLGEPLPSGSDAVNINTGPTNVVIENNTFTGFDRPLLNITLEPLSAAMARSNTFTGKSVAVIHSGSVSGVYNTLSAAITAAPAGATLDVAGDFTDATVTLNKSLTLDGNGDASLTGKIDITANAVTVTGMNISNPGGSYGIQINGVSDATVSDNTLHDIGTSATTSAQAIYVRGASVPMSGITITDNSIGNVGNSGSTASTKGIFLGDSNAAHLLSNVLISGNSISNVAVTGTKGAYGILVNYGFSGAGSVTGLDITDNTIDTLAGGWVHGIGLETDTADTALANNKVSNLDAAGIDEVAVFFEGNAEAGAVLLENNSLVGGAFGVALHSTMPDTVIVDASHNWWGTATSPESRVSGNVTFAPWYVNDALSALSTAPAELEVTAQPGNVQVNTVISPNPSVLVTDHEGNPVSSVTVTAQLTGGAGTLTGTTSVSTNASGIATFSNLAVTSAGSYTLNFAVSGLSSAASSGFTISAAPSPDPEPEPEPDPEPEPEPEEPLVDDLEEIVGSIDIPLPGTGTPIGDDTVTAVGDAATVTAELAAVVAQNIAQVDTSTALDALNAVGSVVDITAAAAASTSTSPDPTQAANVVASGTTALNSFSTLLTAIDTKTNSNAAPAVLSEVQKTAVQEATVKAAAAAVQILAAAPEPGKKREVLETLGKILTSNVNLGVQLTTAQTTTLFTATDQAATTSTDTDTMLETSVPLKPQNKELISKAVLSEALAGTGIADEALDSLLEELADAINPADVRIGDVDGETALEDGFTGAVGAGSVEFDKSTGTIVFKLVAPDPTPPAGVALRRSFAQTVERNIPARVISSNVVASTFPDGIVTRADGSVVITSQRIASIVVPASYDPINMFADLRNLGTVSVDATGNVTIVRPGVLYFSGSFDYRGTTPGTGPIATTSLVPSSGGNASDPDLKYTITYRDGTQQVIQPFVAADSFVDSVRGRGLNIAIARNTGVITVEGQRFRPDYFVDEHDATSRAWWEAHKDASDMAYRIVDANADGIPDYEVHSEFGVQIAYRLP